MDDRFLITVIGTQTIDGESESIEISTEGSYAREGRKVTVCYPEFSEEDPNIRTEASVVLEGDTLIIERHGDIGSSRLILERGRRHQCVYETPFGAMFIGVFTDKLTGTLDEHGGEIYASYQLDFNAGAVSTNEIRITVRKKY